MDIKIFECDRCGNKMVESSLYGIHDCVDSDGIHYDYCYICWSEHTKDIEDITNLIIS